jgi:nucleotide-binding universal stress UspA family protein
MICLKRILVPTDFSDSARHALTYGISFAREYEAELLLLHVVETVPVGYASDLFPVPMAEVFQEMSGYAKTELGKVAEEARGKGVTVRETVVQGKPSAEIATARACWTRRSSDPPPSGWCGARPARC